MRSRGKFGQGRAVELRYAAFRLRFATLAPCFPSAVRVDFERWEIVRFFFAAVAAFLIFFLAAAFCFALAMIFSSL
jgi:hypothetical protein